MTKFESRFFRALNEQDEPSMDRQAMEQSLDKGTPPSKFDINPATSDDNSDIAQHTAAISQSKIEQHNKDISILTEWQSRVKEMIEYLVGSGTDDISADSVHGIIQKRKSEDPSNIFHDVDKSTTNVVNGAKDLSSFLISVSTVLNDKNNAKYKGS